MNPLASSGKYAVVTFLEPSDGALIAQSVARPELFTAIFDRHYRVVYRYVSQRVGQTTADDVAAETFARAFERRSTFDPAVGTARPWLLGIAVKLLAHHRRSEARRLRALAALTQAAGSGDSLADSAASRVDAASARHRLVEALQSLNDYDREVLLFYAWADLTYEEIAAALWIPVGTVRSRLNRARLKLQRALDAEAADIVRLPRGASHV